MDGSAAVRYILDNNIEGDLVECGVDNGNFERIWIGELMKHNATRHIHLYDTFGGLTEPSQYDYTCKNATIYKMNNDEVYNTWKKQIINDTTNGWCFTPLEKVQQSLNSTGYPQEYLHYVVGDVMETLKDTSKIPEKIAILRLDTDWYESSKYELEQMYNNVVTGGIIIFDDYYHWDGQRRATDEYFKSINMQYDFVNIGNAKTAAIIKKCE
jgi:hypothetical protein